MLLKFNEAATRSVQVRMAAERNRSRFGPSPSLEVISLVQLSRNRLNFVSEEGKPNEFRNVPDFSSSVVH